MRKYSEINPEFKDSNFEIIEKLVESHFSLSEKSLERFKNELEDFTLDQVYFNFLKKFDSKDLRVRVPLTESFLSYFDTSWKDFKKVFTKYVNERNLSYGDYRRGKVLVEKNEIKISKDIKNFYGEMFIETYADIFINITNKKLSKKNNLELVFSWNFADWFLASTENSWTSCLDLESDYEEYFWAGLPGTIVDKNRVMVYITDGRKKEYQGIEVDKVNYRSWGIINKKNIIILQGFYPSRDITTKKVVNEFKKATGLRFSNLSLLKDSDNEDDLLSKHEIDFLYDNEEESVFIYLDNFKVVSDFYNKYKLSAMDNKSGYFKVSNGTVSIGKSNGSYCEGLGNLIDNNKQILEATDNLIYCEYTDQSYTEDEIIYFNDTPMYVGYYEENVGSCEICGEDCFLDELHRTGDGQYVCENCLVDEFSSCEYDNEYYPTEDCIYIEQFGYFYKRNFTRENLSEIYEEEDVETILRRADAA